MAGLAPMMTTPDSLLKKLKKAETVTAKEMRTPLPGYSPDEWESLDSEEKKRLILESKSDHKRQGAEHGSVGSIKKHEKMKKE